MMLMDFHQNLGARFVEMNHREVPEHYGDILGEHAALRHAAGVIDLSFRGRLCLTGADRQRFLHGQVTNDVAGLAPGAGCYAALVTAKGKLVSDLNIFLLQDEILLDFEPGLTETITQRLEKYIIADDVQIVDVTPHYGLMSVQGPSAAEVIRQAEFKIEIPVKEWSFSRATDENQGEIYLMNNPRVGSSGFDLFLPVPTLRAGAERLLAAAQRLDGRLCGWQALEIARVEAGIPRFGADMDESNLAPEAGLAARAISYTKGCYIGQEVIARIRTYGQVAKSLRGLRLSDNLEALPVKGDKLLHDGKVVGYITSAVESPMLKAKIALGYVRREVNQTGTALEVRFAVTQGVATVVELPFRELV